MKYVTVTSHIEVSLQRRAPSVLNSELNPNLEDNKAEEFQQRKPCHGTRIERQPGDCENKWSEIKLKRSKMSPKRAYPVGKGICASRSNMRVTVHDGAPLLPLGLQICGEMPCLTHGGGLRKYFMMSTVCLRQPLFTVCWGRVSRF